MTEWATSWMIVFIIHSLIGIPVWIGTCIFDNYASTDNYLMNKGWPFQIFGILAWPMWVMIIAIILPLATLYEHIKAKRNERRFRELIQNEYAGTEIDCGEPMKPREIVDWKEEGF